MELNTTERRVLHRATALIVAGTALRLVCGPGQGGVEWQPPPAEERSRGRERARQGPPMQDEDPGRAGGRVYGQGRERLPGPGLAAHRESVEEATRRSERAATPLFPGERIPLNSAPAEELQRLRGIGPVLAERILAERRRRGGFRRVEELLEVSGIGPKTLARIRHHITVP